MCLLLYLNDLHSNTSHFKRDMVLVLELCRGSNQGRKWLRRYSLAYGYYSHVAAYSSSANHYYDHHINFAKYRSYIGDNHHHQHNCFFNFSKLKLCVPNCHMWPQQALCRWHVLQPMGLLWNFRCLLRDVLPKWQLLRPSTNKFTNQEACATSD